MKLFPHFTRRRVSTHTKSGLEQQSRGNATDDLLKTMDDFGSQVSSQLDGSGSSVRLVILSKNIAFRVDRVSSRKMVSLFYSIAGDRPFINYFLSGLESTELITFFQRIRYRRS